MKKKQSKERQYKIPVKAIFISVASSKEEAKKFVEYQLSLMNVVDVEIGPGQMSIPQEEVDFDAFTNKEE